MVDIDTRKIVDLIESRASDKVSDWLKSFPNIKIVSRDGSIEYKKAIETAHPNSIQISDRFHLLKNLTEYLKEFIKREFKVKIELGELDINQQTEVIDLKIKEKYKFDTKWDLILKIKDLRESNYSINSICNILGVANKTVIKYSNMPLEDKEKYANLPIRRLKPLENRKRKEMLINEVKNLYKKDYTMIEISRKLNIDARTVKKYIHCKDISQFISRIQKESILDPYTEDIHNMLSEKLSARGIYNEIKSKGYTGSERSVSHYIKTIKSEIATDNDKVKMDFVYRKDIIKLLYKNIGKIKEITDSQFNKLITMYEQLKNVFEVISEFKTLLKEKDLSKLDDWIKYCKSLGIRELNSFISGLERDKAAVKNAISHTYSNGLAEGKINKIKLIKRIMFGRCNFDILKIKILESER